MPRKWLVVSLILFAATWLYGCPKKDPVTPDPGPTVEVETVDTEPDDFEEPEAPEVMDDTEVDPFASEDLREVNEAAAREGYSADIYFEFDESNLSEEARRKLSDNARFLQNHPEFVVTVEGHCDERGTNEYNLALGQRRSNTAVDYMVSLGIGADRFRTISYGEERPVCTESSESCWQRNRRAHMPITGRR
jgi:peptidoglycan-associated lipoprotein